MFVREMKVEGLYTSLQESGLVSPDFVKLIQLGFTEPWFGSVLHLNCPEIRVPCAALGVTSNHVMPC